MTLLTPSDVSLIVPVWNGGELFARCLRAIEALAPPPGEVFVVDDGSSDNSRARAEQAGVTVLVTRRAGPGQARNAAARRARGQILMFVDADVLLRPDAIQRVVETFHADPDLIALYGSYDEEPAAQNFVSQYKNLFHHFVHQDSNGAATSFWAGCGAIRRDVFLRLGGFSSEYTRPSIEDIELGYRLKRQRYRSQLVKGLQVTHLKRWSLWSLIETDVLGRAIPWTRLILRDREFPTDLNLKLSHRLSVALVYLMLAALGGGFWLPALWLLSVLCALALWQLNRSLYRFFAERRGMFFALRAIPLHWLYYVYSGSAFAYGLLMHILMLPSEWMRTAESGQTRWQ